MARFLIKTWLKYNQSYNNQYIEKQNKLKQLEKVYFKK